MSDVTVNYDVVSEIAGHQPNRGVVVVEAARDIFSKVKERAMQVAIKGQFIQFDTVDELQNKLEIASHDGFSIKVFDEDIGG